MEKMGCIPPTPDGLQMLREHSASRISINSNQTGSPEEVEMKEESEEAETAEGFFGKGPKSLAAGDE